jgi:hypothetical protein
MENIENKNFDEMYKLDEASFWSWLGGLFKKFSKWLTKEITDFNKAIQNEKDPTKIVQLLQKFLNANKIDTEKNIKYAASPEDIHTLMSQNVQAIYTAISAIQAINQVGGNFKFAELFPAKPDLIKAMSFPQQKALGDNGAINVYVDKTLMPKLKNLAGYKDQIEQPNTNQQQTNQQPAAVTESFKTFTQLLEDTTTTTTNPVTPAAEVATPEVKDPTTNSTTNTSNTAANNTNVDDANKNTLNKQQPNKPVTKDDLVPGAIITWNKNGKILKGRVLKDQSNVDANSVSVEQITECFNIYLFEGNVFALPIKNILTVEEQPVSAEMNKLKQMALQWYETTFLKPIFDKATQLTQQASATAATAGAKKGDLSTYNNPQITQNPEAIKDMGEIIKTMDKPQLTALKDYLTKATGKQIGNL